MKLEGHFKHEENVEQTFTPCSLGGTISIEIVERVAWWPKEDDDFLHLRGRYLHAGKATFISRLDRLVAGTITVAEAIAEVEAEAEAYAAQTREMVAECGGGFWVGARSRYLQDLQCELKGLKEGRVMWPSHTIGVNEDGYYVWGSVAPFPPEYL